ncbi:hypothetical protein Tco_0878683 [Tanacetum coccineum]|uniref:Uncharacterized protein n=1 Tax=Tanacetum coccineum TaxID=301880 RepID=A0ABQ5C1U3_9ASTR
MLGLESSLVGIVRFLQLLLDVGFDLCPVGGFHDANLRLTRMINNVSVKLRVAIEEYQLFTQELEASPGWVVNKDRSIEYLQELVQRDEEMVQRLQALEREVEERADEKMLFIKKLKGNAPFK